MRIGICDWGIGGLGFDKLLRENRPDIDVDYLGDQGYLSYGRVPTKELAARIRWVLAGFRDRGVSQVVVACNAASTVLGEATISGMEARGVIKPALARIACDKSSVGIIGGRRTILTGSYRRPLAALGIPVSQRVAQPLSGLIEAGCANESSTHDLLRSILRPIRHSNRLVLACTHYVVLEPVVIDYMPHAQIIDPASEVWAQMRSELPAPSGKTGTTSFYTTGDPARMETQALSAFGVCAKVEPWS